MNYVHTLSSKADELHALTAEFPAALQSIRGWCIWQATAEFVRQRARETIERHQRRTTAQQSAHRSGAHDENGRALIRRGTMAAMAKFNNCSVYNLCENRWWMPTQGEEEEQKENGEERTQRGGGDQDSHGSSPVAADAPQAAVAAHAPAATSIAIRGAASLSDPATTSDNLGTGRIGVLPGSIGELSGHDEKASSSSTAADASALTALCKELLARDEQMRQEMAARDEQMRATMATMHEEMRTMRVLLKASVTAATATTEQGAGVSLYDLALSSGQADAAGSGLATGGEVIAGGGVSAGSGQQAASSEAHTANNEQGTSTRQATIPGRRLSQTRLFV